MRFGIDFDSEVLPARPLEHVFQEPELDASRNFGADTSKIGPESVLAVELLNSTLARMDALQILQLEATKSSRQRKLDSIHQASRSRVEYINSVVNLKVNQERQRQDEEVRKIIELHEKLRREEEERQRLLREKIEREKREEEQRKQKKLEEEKKQQEEEKKQKQLQAKLLEEKKAKEEQEKLEAQRKLKEKLRLAKEEAAKKAQGITNWDAVEKELFKYRQDILDIKRDVVEEMNKNKDMKKNVNVVKRKINIKFGQLSSLMSQLNTISREVADLVNYTKPNPLAYKWILNFIAKAVVAQAEAEVTVKPTAAIPLARLTAYLLNHLEGLDYYLCARFAKKCAFIIGYTCPIDTEEGRVRMGWKRSDGKWESEVKYEERVGGIATVWAVMARLDTAQKFAFFSMPAEWKFVARTLNRDKALIGNVHYGIICNWWEAAAANLVQTYNRQAQKMLNLAVGPWAKYGQLKSFPAATRLEILGEDYRTKNTFNLIKDMEP